MTDVAGRSKGPARGYSWPPLQPGHTLTLRHGVYSERAVSARALEVLPDLLAIAPHLADRDDPARPAVEWEVAIAAWLRVEARARLIAEEIDRAASERGVGRVATRLLETANSTDRLAADLASRLGLDPAGKAKIAAQLADAGSKAAGLAELKDHGRRTRAGQRPAIDAPALDEADGGRRGD